MSDASGLLRSYAAGEWRALAVAAISSLAVVISYLARPLPLALAVDQILDRGTPFELTAGDWRALIALALLVLAIVLLNTLGSHFADDSLERASERIVHRLRVATYARLQRLSLSFHERQRTGNLVTHVNGDVNAVGSFFADSLGGAASAGMVLLGMLAVSLIVDPLMAATAFAAAPALAFIASRYQPRVRALAKRRRAVAGEIASLSDESLSSIRAVKALGGETFEEERLERKSEELQAVSRESMRLEGRMSILVDSLGGVALALVVVVGVARAAAGAITIGELIILYTYARRIDRPLRTLARTTARASRSLARAERIAEILGSDEVVEDRPGAYKGGQARGEIELRDVVFSYEPERPAIAGLSLHVPAGQKLALVGRSGAGKSTLAALMARLYDPVDGRVLIDGRDVRDCSVAWLREQFGLVLQETMLFTGTVAENIAYGVEEADREAVVAAAKAAGADDFISELPDGYDSVLGPQAVALSGGQRQRIAIARTLLRDPSVLIFDEPTMGLDAASEAAVLAGLEELARGRTTIVITHSHRLAATAERVVAVDAGGIARDGPPEQVLAEDVHDGGGAVAASAGSVPVPADPALPSMRDVLDPDVMADVLARSLADGAGRPEVLVHHVRYSPGRGLVVHYQVGVEARWHHATAMISRADLGRRARRPESLALANLVDGRSPAPDPLFYEPSIDALIQWLPLDLSLLGLAVPPAHLERRLSAMGVMLEDDGEEPSLLAYKPRRRAVVRLDRHVLRYYSDRVSFDQGLTGLRYASALRSVRTPEFEASLPQLLLTVQSHVAGPQPSPALAAREAGQLLARLHHADAERLPAFGPAQQLAAAADAAGLVAHLVPELESRLEMLVVRLEDTSPGPLEPVACHGDFSARQLIRSSRELVLTDFDSMCAGPASLDHATWFAHLVRGGRADLDRALEALEVLLEGYGVRPPELEWYLATMLLRRARRPFRHQDEDWPERTREMVAAAERVCP